MSCKKINFKGYTREGLEEDLLHTGGVGESFQKSLGPWQPVASEEWRKGCPGQVAIERAHLRERGNCIREL